jgi:hypothetical protein
MDMISILSCRIGDGRKSKIDGSHRFIVSTRTRIFFTEIVRMKSLFFVLAIVGILASFRAKSLAPTHGPILITPATEKELRDTYKRLIDAENAHDIAAVRTLLWNSPSALFVAKTKTPAEGNWAGFWGADVVLDHLSELYQGTFVMAPDYSRERVVLLSSTVAETYVPLSISVAYAGQSGTPKPFLMIVEWVREHGAWKMATDIALPIPTVATP